MIGKLPDFLKLLPALAIVFGSCMLIFYGIRHLPELTRGAITDVQHPVSYQFTTYDGLLQKYVKDGLVDYKSLSKDPDLQKAVDELEHISPDKINEMNDQLAFWLNASNLLTLKVICERYPIKSIGEISNENTQRKFIIGGETLSLQDIHARLMSALKDKRSAVENVFLICRGSQGYPPLGDHALTGQTLETDAKVAVYSFINDPKNVYYDPDSVEFLLSPLMKRYEQIIEHSKRTPHEWAVLYMDAKKPPNVGNVMLTKTYFPKLDYTLNDTALAPVKEAE